MFLNFIKITLRNLYRNKSYTVINVAGLSLGTVCALVIFSMLRFEYSYDTYHHQPEQIYRIVHFENEFGKDIYSPGLAYPMPRALRTDFPEFENLTIVDQNMGWPVLTTEDAHGNQVRQKEKSIAFVEPDYFNIFDYEWLIGDQSQALEKPNSVVISEDIALKYFGEVNPVGKRINFNSQFDLQVTGVIASPSQNTDLPFKILARFQFDEEEHGNWRSISSAVQCYVRLKSKVNPKQLEEKLDAFITKHRDKEAAERFDYGLQPLNELHFDTRYANFNRTVAKETLLALVIIAIALLLAGCINFVNLNTAIAVQRSKEVGVRKVLGSSKSKLILRFMTETAIITFFTFAISVALAEIVATQLTTMLGYELQVNALGVPAFQVFLLSVFLFVTLAAGYYPANYVASFSPIDALRNKLTGRYTEGLSMRRGLIVVQFIIAQVLILCTLVIGSQMKYFYAADMGFNKQAVIEMELPSNEASRLQLFKNEVLAHSAILNVSYSNTGTASENIWTGNFHFKDGETLKEGRAHLKFIDPDFLETYGVELLVGTASTDSDTLKQFLINETFAQANGYGADYQGILGKYVKVWGRESPISGVVKDFNSTSLHEKVKPAIMIMQNRYWLSAIKIQSGQAQPAIKAMEQAWMLAFPEHIFEYRFLDDSIASFYEEEQQLANLMNLFTAIAVIIGCLGLFGLVSYMTTQRTKEIGVRKVLGAGVVQIVSLFSKEFAALLFTAFAVAMPVAYLLMESWLESFAYRIEQGPGLFIVALAASFLVALLAVGWKSVRAALANPADSLRTE